MSTPQRFFASLLVALSPFGAKAALSIPAIFTDHMVLQSGGSDPVWGWDDPGAAVTVRIAGQSLTTHAGTDGRWQVNLSPLHPEAPQPLTIEGSKTVVIADVLVGEVWLGSGQSNMALTVDHTQNFPEERASAQWPQIRMYREDSGSSLQPQRIGKGKWTLCSPASVGGYSAALYFFGREIHRALRVPVGLINSSVGGTVIESWIAPETQRADPRLQPYFPLALKDNAAIANPAAMEKYRRNLAAWTDAVDAAKANHQPPPPRPASPADAVAHYNNIGGLFNGKIAPLIPYAIRGALWYQGEANSTPAKAPFYELQLRMLVTDWRRRWGSEFPFAWAQLPNLIVPGRDWPAIREAELHALALPRTGMGINIDIGDPKQIHAPNKQEVGRRLSLWALGAVYGRAVPSTSGPLPAGYEAKGSELVVHFTHCDGGLVAKGPALQGFVIAGEDRIWKPAQARIAGDTVLVWSPDVPKPAAARYAWENNPTCNLYNGAGLPASPFRTDDWNREEERSNRD